MRLSLRKIVTLLLALSCLSEVATAKKDCAGGGIFLLFGSEHATVDSEPTQQMTALGGVLERPGLCTAMKQSSYVLGFNLEGTYAFGKFRQPSFSVKSAGLGPSLCYRSKGGTGLCLVVLGQIIEAKDGATFIDFTSKQELSAQMQLTTSLALRISAAHTSYPLNFTPVRKVDDITLLAGFGIVPPLPTTPN